MGGRQLLNGWKTVVEWMEDSCWMGGRQLLNGWKTIVYIFYLKVPVMMVFKT